jgi:hypothetical protein
MAENPWADALTDPSMQTDPLTSAIRKAIYGPSNQAAPVAASQPAGQPASPSGGGQTMNPYEALALQSLYGAQEQPKEKSWGDVGKGLMAPLAVGLLSSLVYPKYGGRAAGIGQGIQAGVQTYELQQKQEAERRAAAQKAAYQKANILAHLGQIVSNEELRKEQIKQTGQHQNIMEHQGEQRLQQGDQRLVLDTKRVEQGDIRENRIAKHEETTEALNRERVALEREQKNINAGQYELKKTELDMKTAAVKAEYGAAQALIDNLKDSKDPNDQAVVAMLKAGALPSSKGVQEMLKRGAQGGKVGTPRKVIDVNTGKQKVLFGEDYAKQVNEGQVKPYSEAENTRLNRIMAGRSGIGLLMEAMSRPSILEAKEKWAATKLKDYWWNYRLWGGAGLTEDEKNLRSAIDFATQQAAGLSTAITNNRSLAMIKMVDAHFPKQQDRMATLYSKMRTITLGADLAIDAEGYGGDLIQDPKGLARAKALLHLDRASSPPDYERATAQIVALNNQWVEVDGKLMTKFEYMTKMQAGELPTSSAYTEVAPPPTAGGQ